MENHILEWLNLTIRWIHLIVGVAWIGASFYFNWLENRLDRLTPVGDGVAGQLWAIHGGGFYHLEKFEVAPAELPESLHWFKWEAYATLLSGIALLVSVYYLNATAYLIDPSKAALEPAVAIVIGLGSLAFSWLVYDGLCKSPLRRWPIMLALAIGSYFTGLAFALDLMFSGRAVYIHVGAAIGTVMVANVFFVIIPGQRELVEALVARRDPDPVPGRNALLRSRHNNYFTLPVLFTMISGHFPSTYGGAHPLLVLLALSAVAVAVRHYFNIRHEKPASAWLLAGSFVVMIAVMWFTMPTPVERESTLLVPDRDIAVILRERCTACHSDQPTHPGFSAPPGGLSLEDMATVIANAERIYISAVATNTMPLGNLTGMTEPERAVLGMWLESKIEAGQ